MNNLSLNNLECKREEVLKAELTSLFPLLEKTFTKWWSKKGFFKSYSIQHNIKKEYDNLISGFKNINLDLSVTSGTKTVPPINAFKDFINSGWRSWGKIKLKNNPEKFLQVLYRSCEGINSGIEKGFPSNTSQISQISDKPYLSSSFGTVRYILEDKDLNKLRGILFNGKNLQNDLKTTYIDRYRLVGNPKILDKNVIQVLKNLGTGTNDIVCLRIRLYNLLYIIYSNIPSDSRFPANDTSLFDQAYMSTSLFKAALSGILLSSSNAKINIDNFNHKQIKWSVLGVQYDKLGLAEKGLKAASIEWYRDASEKTDNDIKKLLEIQYPLGNEVYRDETGIYFVVAKNVVDENVKCEKEGDFYKLCSGLDKIKQEIQKIFTTNFEGEVYPAICLTSPSRGLMNLGHLVEKASDNYLKAEYPKDFKNKLKHDCDPNGICQVCNTRLAHKGKKENLICDVCEDRLTGRIENWVKNFSGETIWVDELQDKNGRVALVSLKFELGEWLNGDLLNSLLTDELDFKNRTYKKYINDIKKGIKNNKTINKTLRQQFHTNILSSLTLRDLYEKWLLERSIGDAWEKFILVGIKDWNTSGNTPNGRKINFEKRVIHWDQLTNDDIEFLSRVFLQFLLRKNPSPARLRRVWETTKEFFEILENNIIDLAKIPKNRAKRLVWDGVNIPDGEYNDGEILFWAKDKKVFLISSIEKIGNKDDFNLKKYKDANSNIIKLLNKVNANEISYKPYFTILKPTPVSWQFIIPAQYVPNLIENIEREYYKHFKWVYGKLPLHIGIVVQNYKKPLYVGIKALRKIRRDMDGTEIKELYKSPKIKFKNIQNDIKNVIIDEILKGNPQANKEDLRKKLVAKDLPKLLDDIKNDKLANSPGNKIKIPNNLVLECKIDTHKFYSLYGVESPQSDNYYEFYLFPEVLKTPPKYTSLTSIDNSDESGKNAEIFIPNTFDFEFLDTNSRRNDIYYNKTARRVKPLKSQRPHNIKDFKYFKKFKEYFKKDDKSSSQLEKFATLIYSKLESWKDDVDSVKDFTISAFQNVMSLKDDNSKNGFAQVLGMENFGELQNLSSDEFKEKLIMFLDMFEFWHTILKEV